MNSNSVARITGQEGAYLVELLLNQGSVVHGIKRRASLFNAQRIDHHLVAQPGLSPRGSSHE
jgi:GDPmannose 4,6-dehydratase